jgi:aspartokinase/homoserine dehydrogenase 1
LHLLKNFNLDFRVRGIATSSKMYLAERRVDLQNWRAELEQHGEALDWERFSAHVNPDHLPHAVMIDCTADGAVADSYTDWFNAGIHVVTPNKKAQSGPLAAYDAMLAARKANQVHFLYETACGAALPIIQTLQDLIETGDEVHSIEGIFSGTLAYLFNVFDGTVAFSEIVRQARDSGYTEPDPRDDLSGMDVARKLSILARELGMRIELSDIDIESLVPGELDSGTPEEFLVALSAYDASMLERLNDARSRGEVLRYVGRIDIPNGSASVRLCSLPKEHSFAHINLTDNIVSFASGRYSENPLVVQGPGAGPDVTAAGVFADLLRLSRYLGEPG